MTAIAFKDGVLAADSGLFNEQHLVIGEAFKIDPVGRGWYTAAAGNCACGQRVVERMRKVRKPWALPLSFFEQECVETEGVLVGPSGEVFTYRHDTGLEDARGSPWIAVGAMENFLWGCMASGRSAQEAVALACKHHALAREPVNVVKVWK